MIHKRLIYKLLGSLLFIEVFMMICCLLMSVYYREEDTFAFLISAIVTTCAAFLLLYSGRKATNNLSIRDAFLVVTLVWVVFSMFGSLPLMISGYLPDFTDAYLETMSGFTTTGATVIDNVDGLPHGLLFWRSLTHWIGGLGIVFFTVALLPSMVGGSVQVFSIGKIGPIKSKFAPRLTTEAKWIWTVYIILTLLCWGAYVICGMGTFDGINYAMSTTGTGGFSTHNASVAYFNSPSLEYTASFFMLASAINFSLLYFLILKLDFKKILKSEEVRFFLTTVAVFTLFIAYLLVSRNGYDVEHALRSSLFQVSSFITSTGFASDNPSNWCHITWIILSLCMIIGGCTGSTSGGLKCIRCVMLFKNIRNEFRQRLHPNAVIPLYVDGNNITLQGRVSLLSFSSLYLGLILLGIFVFRLIGINGSDAITISISCMGNDGPAIGPQINPLQSWSSLPATAKWLCSALMLMGRLEIFTVLTLFIPQFWKEN